MLERDWCRVGTRLAAVCIGLAVPVGAAAEDALSCLPDGLAPVTVAGTIDGDTLALDDGRVVRLAGIAAPKRPPGAAAATDAEAAARDALAGMVAGAPVFIVAAGAPDRYGRLRADVFAGGEADRRWLQRDLAAAGAAKVVRPQGEAACIAALYDAEAAAIAARRGLWADPDLGVKDAADPALRDRIGHFEVIEGRVVSVGGRTYMTFLDFGRDYARDFTIMITPKMADRLESKGVRPDTLAGRRVRVRGVLESAGGPAIRLKRVNELTLMEP